MDVMSGGAAADDSTIVTGSADCTVRVWDIRQPERGAVEVLHGHTDAVRALRRRDLGRRVVSLGEDGGVLEWELGGKGGKGGAGGAGGEATLLGRVESGGACLGVEKEGGLLLGAWDGSLHFW